MSFSYEEFLGLSLPSDGDTDHGEELRQNYTALGRAMAPDNIYYVSPAFTEAELYCSNASDRRHFDTIQAAINAAQHATSYSSPATVLIWPGTYNEKLTITGTVTLLGYLPQYNSFLGASGYGVKIRGDGTNTPVINWSPAEGYTHALGLVNLFVDNSYATQNAVLINDAYALKVNSQAAVGPYSNRLLIRNCHFKMQTIGDDNRWAYGLDINGYVNTTIWDSQIYAYGYAGGNNNGGVLYPINVNGTSNSSYKSSLFFYKSVAYQQNYDPTLTPTIFRCGGETNTYVTYSSWYMNTADPIYIDAAGGTNSFYGLSGDITDRYNLAGVSSVLPT